MTTLEELYARKTSLKGRLVNAQASATRIAQSLEENNPRQVPPPPNAWPLATVLAVAVLILIAMVIDLSSKSNAFSAPAPKAAISSARSSQGVSIAQVSRTYYEPGKWWRQETVIQSDHPLTIHKEEGYDGVYFLLVSQHLLIVRCPTSATMKFSRRDSNNNTFEVHVENNEYTIFPTGTVKLTSPKTSSPP